MKKIVINNCYGGFGLSIKAQQYYLKLKGKGVYFYKGTLGKDEYRKISAEQAGDEFVCHVVTKDCGEICNETAFADDIYFSARNINRDDQDLIKTVEELGIEASGRFAKLEIVEIPNDIEWEIEDYDGHEWISEKHRTW